MVLFVLLAVAAATEEKSKRGIASGAVYGGVSTSKGGYGYTASIGHGSGGRYGVYSSAGTLPVYGHGGGPVSASNGYLSAAAGPVHLVSRHVQITNRLAVPIAQPYPVHIDRPVPVPVPHPVKVPVDKPYPVAVPQAVPVPVIKNIPVPVDTPVAVPVPHAVPVPVARPVPVAVPRPVAVPVVHPYAVPVPSPVAVNKHLAPLGHHHW